MYNLGIFISFWTKS